MIAAATAPYVVQIHEGGGFSVSDAISAVSALAAVFAVVFAVISTGRTLKAQRESSLLAERRALALRIAAWSATVEAEVERHVFSNFERKLDQPTESDPVWVEIYAALDREQRRLDSEAGIILGSRNPVSDPMRDLLRAAEVAEHGLQSWRAAEFVRVREGRVKNPERTAYEEAVEEASSGESRESRQSHVGPHRMPIVTAAISLSRSLADVARTDWSAPTQS